MKTYVYYCLICDKDFTYKQQYTEYDEVVCPTCGQIIEYFEGSQIKLTEEQIQVLRDHQVKKVRNSQIKKEADLQREEIEKRLKITMNITKDKLNNFSFREVDEAEWRSYIAQFKKLTTSLVTIVDPPCMEYFEDGILMGQTYRDYRDSNAKCCFILDNPKNKRSFEDDITLAYTTFKCAVCNSLCFREKNDNAKLHICLACKNEFEVTDSLMKRDSDFTLGKILELNEFAYYCYISKKGNQEV